MPNRIVHVLTSTESGGERKVIDMEGEGGGGERRDGMEESLYVLITYVVEKDGEENGGLWQ
ncbi:hypothetical protein OUZ56_031203 [Daphnia magna]|uniref:Uncharacterized protein n=1 Tax=Daphnia magna TaxID=35525 RepID=A0ABQ9ZUR2_9CRUS|nr:hypothetical protein OUZ56_031203 [Daphnia magna]